MLEFHQKVQRDEDQNVVAVAVKDEERAWSTIFQENFGYVSCPNSSTVSAEVITSSLESLSI